MQIKNIQGVQKRNGYIVIALIDKVGNMIVKNEDNTLSHIENVPEHEENLQQISMMQNFIIDKEEYTIHKGGVKNKYNYLLDDTYSGDRINVCDNVSKYQFDDLLRIMRNHEIYKKENMFISGSSKLLKAVLPYVDSVILTVVDHDYSNEKNVIDKFPIEEYTKHFKKKKVYTSDTAKTLEKMSKGLQPDNREIVIMNDYFKMVKKNERIAGTHNVYKFVTFTR